MNCDLYPHVRPAKGCADHTKRRVLASLVLLNKATCSPNIFRYISCLNRQCLRGTVSVVELLNITVHRRSYYMLGWIKNPHTCGKVAYALALLESQTRFPQDSSHVPRCRLDISVVNHLLICHTGARPILSLEDCL